MGVNTTPRPFRNKVVLQRLLLVVALSVYSATVVANVSEPLVTAKRSESLAAEFVVHYHDSEPHLHRVVSSPIADSAVSGKVSSQQQVVSDEILLTSDMVSATTTTGALKALLVPLDAEGLPARSREVWQSLGSSAAESLRLASRGLMTLTVDLFTETVRIPAPSCDSYEADSTAVLNAVRAKMSLETYRFVILGYPATSLGCASRGSMPGQLTWIHGASNSVLAHELGHNLSLEHQNFTRCVRDGVGVQQIQNAQRNSTNCVWKEYGGPYSVMGIQGQGAEVRVTFLERAQAGWLFEGEEVFPASGNYSLHFDGKPALMWVSNAEGEIYALEYVRGKSPEVAWSIYDPATGSWVSPSTRSHSGLLVHHITSISSKASRHPRGVSVKSTLLDMNPGTAFSLDAALGPGERFVDPAGGLEVSVFSVDSAKVDFSLAIGAPLRTPSVANVKVERSSTLGEATVSWDPGVFPAPQTFTVEVSKSADFSTPVIASKDVSTFSSRWWLSAYDTAITVPDVKYLENYYVRVTAKSGAGAAAASASSELRWLPPVPARVEGVRVAQQYRPGVVDVSWSKVEALSAVTGYEVHVFSNLDTWATEYKVTTTDLSTRVQIPNLLYDKTYWVHVKAVNAGGVGATGSALGLRWAAPVVPAAPIGVTATAGAVGQLSVTWSPLAEWHLVDNYEIEVATSADFSAGSVVSVTGSTGTSAVVVVPNAIRGKPYFMRVSAVNLAGKGSWSTTRQVSWAATVAPTTPSVKTSSLTCRRGKKTRVFVGASCPARWSKVG
ncbi:MAG: fibronectin type III domain-containing protein [Ilumatobacteraceae bacterium]